MRYLVTIFLALLCLSCSKNGETIPEKQTLSVKCVQIKKTVTTPRIKLKGVTEPYRTVNLSFRVSGVIDKINISKGAGVKKNDILMTLEDKDFKLQESRAIQVLTLAQSRLKKIQAKALPEEILAAEARVKAAQTSYANAQKNYTSQQKLAQSSIISQIELDKLKTQAHVFYEEIIIAKQNLILLKKGARIEDIQLAIDEVSSSEVETDIAEQNIEYLALEAPFAGIVTSLPVEIKEFISRGKTVIVIDDLYKIKLNVSASASQVAQIKAGQDVDVYIDSLAKEKGKVTYVAAKTEAISKTFTVEIEIKNPEIKNPDLKNPDLKIRAGMFATADIHIGITKEIILIPPQCILQDSLGNYVFTLVKFPEQNQTTKIVRKEIKIGKLIKNRVQVLEGVEVDDWVVMEGQHYVTPNEEVYVKKIEQ